MPSEPAIISSVQPVENKTKSRSPFDGYKQGNFNRKQAKRIDLGKQIKKQDSLMANLIGVFTFGLYIAYVYSQLIADINLMSKAVFKDDKNKRCGLPVQSGL